MVRAYNEGLRADRLDGHETMEGLGRPPAPAPGFDPSQDVLVAKEDDEVVAWAYRSWRRRDPRNISYRHFVVCRPVPGRRELIDQLIDWNEAGLRLVAEAQGEEGQGRLEARGATDPNDWTDSLLRRGYRPSLRLVSMVTVIRGPSTSAFARGHGASFRPGGGPRGDLGGAEGGPWPRTVSSARGTGTGRRSFAGSAAAWAIATMAGGLVRRRRGRCGAGRAGRGGHGEDGPRFRGEGASPPWPGPVADGGGVKGALGGRGKGGPSGRGPGRGARGPSIVS